MKYVLRVLLKRGTIEPGYSVEYVMNEGGRNVNSANNLPIAEEH